MKVFVTVAEMKNFTKAAKKLNFSQPAISQQIKKLEIYFQNTPLLIRSANLKQVELTDEGRLVYQHGKEILAIMEQLSEELAASREKIQPQIRIGASMTIGTHLLPHMLELLRETDPHLVPKIFVGNTRQICEKLNRDEIDIGLIEGKTMYYDFKRVDFLTDPLVLVAAPRLAEDFKEFSPSNLGRAVWIVRENGSGTEQYLQSFLESNHIRIETKIECNSNEANCELVKEGLGITLISRLVVGRELASGQLISLPMNRSYTRKLSYIVKEERCFQPAVAAFTAVLEKLVRKRTEQ